MVKRQKRNEAGYMVPNFEHLVLSHAGYDRELSTAMLYANYTLNPKKLKKETLLYDKKNSKVLSVIQDWKFIGVGKHCWILNNNGELSKQSMDWLSNELVALREYGKELEKTKQVLKEEKTKHKPNIQQKIREQVSNYIGEVESHIDEFLENGFISEVNMYEWLQTNKVKAMQSNKIATYYKPLLGEIQQVFDKPRSELGRSYGLTKTNAKKYLTFILDIISDAERWATNQKATTVKKPRKKKQKTALQLTSKLKYQEKDKTLKLVSITPTQIVGADQLWVYNTKYRTLGVYRAVDRGGLSVKGCTILNFVPSTSVAKKLRKPRDTIDKCLNGGKIILRKLLKELTTKEVHLTGRINSSTILLRIIK